MIIRLENPISGGELNSLFNANLNEERLIKEIVTDSREATPNSLFIALDGVNANGDDYLSLAKSRGALTMSQRRNDADVKVENVESAILRIAAHYKEKLTMLKETVAVTGSVGKTTTKNILGKMLSSKYKTHITEKNYNNFLGVAHTILSAPIDTEMLVIEAGMNHKGELSRISKAISPTLSLITNIGSAHIGNLGSREEIASCKLEILDGMKKRLAVIPYGEELLMSAEPRRTFSVNARDADLCIIPKSVTDKGSVFDIHTANYSLYEIKTDLIGEHILNAIAASAAASDIILKDREALSNSIAYIDKAEVRGEVKRINEIVFLDDTYSASPEAVIAMVKRMMLFSGVKSAVIGDMYELGDKTAPLHEMIGKVIAESGFKRLYAFGIYAEHLSLGAISGGMGKEQIFINKDLNDYVKTAKDILANSEKDEIILVKASHKVNAKRIIDYIDKQITE